VLIHSHHFERGLDDRVLRTFTQHPSVISSCAETLLRFVTALQSGCSILFVDN
jgi:hypothetical protein